MVSLCTPRGKVFKRGSSAALASLSGAVICRTGALRARVVQLGVWTGPALGEPSAEAVTSETKLSEEALERRTRQTHCG